ncbi:MAG: ATP-dependent RNA/DNA helicase IGHMBP2 [Myxococcota bacterium]
MSHEKRDADEQLAGLARLWHREHAAVKARFAEERASRSLNNRVSAGLALKQVEVVDQDAAAGGRLVLVLSATRDCGVRLRPGEPVRLWWDEPESEQALNAVVGRARGGQITVVIDGDLPERFEDGHFNLDKDAPEAVFRRGARALSATRSAKRTSDLGRLREVIFGDRVAEFRREERWEVRDTALNEAQLAAVGLANRADDVALIHGPPGTGKTRTLVEVVVQCVARGEKVLATAASNTAVDNLAERLIAAGLSVVRLGHPARVSPAVEARSLDALLDADGDRALAREWSKQAADIRRKVAAKWDRRAISREERRELYRDAARLNQDARRYIRGLQDAIISACDVVCATAAGSDAGVLGDTQFDTVVLDEATQATDPMALVAIARGKRVVLAGDPCQLAPTVIDNEAARDGLATTAFERLAAAQGAEVLKMLVVQHRMAGALMAFPSDSMYDGRLVADASANEQQLTDLEGVSHDALREGPLVFIDTAGKGWDEETRPDDPSTHNPGNVERVVAEVRRLVRRGLSPRDVAVITPYGAQVRRLRSELADLRAEGLEIGSIDGFQGREKEAIVLDLVRSNSEAHIGFLSDRRRMNVALTRARRWLLVLGDSATLAGHSYYDAFMEAAQVQGAWKSAWEDDPDDPI